MPRAPERGRRNQQPAARQHDRRPSSSARGYGYRWQKYCKGFKQRNPLCRSCLENGRTSPTEAVDHIIPVTHKNDRLFWDVTNHQPLCWSCHSRKTAKENATK